MSKISSMLAPLLASTMLLGVSTLAFAAGSTDQPTDDLVTSICTKDAALAQAGISNTGLYILNNIFSEQWDANSTRVVFDALNCNTGGNIEKWAAQNPYPGFTDKYPTAFTVVPDPNAFQNSAWGRKLLISELTRINNDVSSVQAFVQQHPVQNQ